MAGHALHHLGLLLGACIVVTGCKPEKERQIEHRLESCQNWCELLVGPCGTGPTRSYTTVSDCVQSCAAPDGTVGAGWGYQKSTNEDACVKEWTDHVACVESLSCAAQLGYFASVIDPPPPEERPCWTELDAMLDCVKAHPCCGGDTP